MKKTSNMMFMMVLMMLDHSDAGDGWKISSDRTQLTLVQPRSCVVSCNISNQHGSVLSTARLAVLPHGLTPSPSLSSYLLNYFLNLFHLPFTLDKPNLELELTTSAAAAAAADDDDNDDNVVVVVVVVFFFFVASKFNDDATVARIRALFCFYYFNVLHACLGLVLANVH